MRPAPGRSSPKQFYPPVGSIGQARADDLADPNKDVIRVRYPYGLTCINGFGYHCRERFGRYWHD